MKKMNNKLTVAVVVVTRNRSKPLLRSLESIAKSKYPIAQTIVVDNASTDDTPTIIRKKFSKVKLLIQPENTGAARGRNIGAEAASCDLLFFLDDDAYVSPATIQECVDTLMTDNKIAVVQTKVLSSFNLKKILGIAHDINTTTSLITAFGINETDEGQYNQIIDIPMVGTGWLVRTKIFKQVHGFDEKFFVPYEDSDISLRIRQAGYRIVFCPTANIWHDDLKPTEINSRVRSIGIASPERAFFVGRNKVYFMRKHAKGLGRVLFFGMLLPMFVTYHSIIIISSLRFDILKIYLRGLVAGFTL